MGYIGAGITRFNTADELTVTGDAQIDTTTLVVDSTNNRVGVGNASPATALDVTGIVTADGLTVDGNATIVNNLGRLTLSDSDGTNQKVFLDSNGGSAGITAQNNTSHGTIFLKRYNGTDTLITLGVSSNGDIRFFADDGTTQGLYWDASTQRLGLGTTTPSNALTLNSAAGGTSGLRITSTEGSGFRIRPESSTTTMLNVDSGESMLFGTGGTERMRIDSSGRVGIGTTATTGAKLKVDGGSTAGTIVQAGNAQGGVILGAESSTAYINTTSATPLAFEINNTERMRIDSSGKMIIGGTTHDFSGNHGIQIDSSGSDNANIILRTAGDSETFAVSADANLDAGVLNVLSNDPMIFKTNDTERMRLDTSGNLLVGKTASGVANSGAELQSSGFTSITRDGGPPLQLNRKTSDGDIAVLKKDGTTVGSINTEGGRIAIGTSDTGLYFNDGGDALVGWNISTNTSRGNAIDLGTSGVKFKDLYLSGSVNFSGNEISGTSITIADDAVGTVTPPRNGGFFTIVYNGIGSFPFSTHSSFVYYDVGGSLAISKATDHGSNLSVTTSNVTGTTGTDGHTTVSAQSGVLKIENRSGNSSSYQITFT